MLNFMSGMVLVGWLRVVSYRLRFEQRFSRDSRLAMSLVIQVRSMNRLYLYMHMWCTIICVKVGRDKHVQHLYEKLLNQDNGKKIL